MYNLEERTITRIKDQYIQCPLKSISAETFLRDILDVVGNEAIRYEGRRIYSVNAGIDPLIEFLTRETHFALIREGMHVWNESTRLFDKITEQEYETMYNQVIDAFVRKAKGYFATYHKQGLSLRGPLTEYLQQH
ncbi:MAG: hypothetical protein WC254_07560 [Candidatus Woesearchaeota archaeon]|jgi:hypothetical protein